MRAGSAPARVRGGLVVLRALLRQRRRLLLAGVSIALGVGYLAGTLGLLDRIGAGLDQLASAASDNADVVIEGDVVYESSLEQVRRLVPASLAAAAASVDGVASVSHRIEGAALVSSLDGTPVARLGLSEQPRGINWPEDTSVSNLVLSEGSPPSSDGEVVLDEHSAEVAGVGIGDTVRVAGRGKVGEYTVSGIAESSDAANGGSSLVAFTTDEARLVLDQPSDDNRIAITLDPGADRERVMADLASIAPPGTEVVDGATAARHAEESLTRSFTLVRVLVSAFGVLALLVGTVTVANSLALLHAQRRRLFAGFRLTGATRGQLRTAALAESVALAAVASLVGIPVGVALALVIERALGALGSAVPTAGPLLGVDTALLAVGMGVLATVVAAWRPVRSACSVPPIEAVQEVDPSPTGKDQLAVRSLARALICATAVVAIGLVASLDLVATLVGSFAVGVLVFLAGFVPSGLTSAVATVMRRSPFRPRPLRLVAARDARRNPRRTATTTAAVLLAAAVVSGLAVFLQSFTASVDEAVGDLVSADLVVDSETFTKGGLPADLVAQLGSVDGVVASSAWKLGRGSVGDASVRMTGLDGAAASEVVAPEFVGESPEGIAPDAAWVSAGLAEGLDIGVGDRIPLMFHSGGFEELTVTGIYTTGAGLLGDVVLDGTVLSSQIPATAALVALVRTDGDPDTQAAVEELAESYGVPAVSSTDAFVDRRAEMLRGFERVVLWMLLFTLVQALVGVVNTLVLSVGERRREFGLLRVAGASRRALMRMVLFEGVAFSSVGTVLGLGLGVAAAAAGVWALGTLGFGVFAIPSATLLGVGLAAVALGVAAAWIPARIAASVPPLDAVADIGADRAPRRAKRPVATRAVPGRVPHDAPGLAPEAAAATVPMQGSQPATAPAPEAAPVTPPPFDPSRLPPPVQVPQAPPVAVPLSVAGMALSEMHRAETDVGTAPEEPQHQVVAGEPASSDGLPGVDPWVGEIRQTRPGVPVPPEPSRPPGEEPVPGAHADDAPQSRADRRSRRVEARDRRPPRRVRRGARASPAEGFVADPQGIGPHETTHQGSAPQDIYPEGTAPDGTAPDGTAPDGIGPELPTRGWAGRGVPVPAPPGTASGGGLEAASRRLDAGARTTYAGVLGSMDAALATGEYAGPLVCGMVRGALAAATRTDRRILVVVQLPNRMALESLHPIATGVLLRPGPGGTLVVALLDRGRRLELTDVVDLAEAESLTVRDALASGSSGGDVAQARRTSTWTG